MTINAITKTTKKGTPRIRGIGRGGSEEEDIERFGLELSQKIVNATEGFTDYFIRLLKKQLLPENIEKHLRLYSRNKSHQPTTKGINYKYYAIYLNSLEIKRLS